MQIARFAAAVAIAVACSACGAARAGAQQTSACRGPDSTSAELIERILYHTNATDSSVAATRDSLRLSRAQAWQVVLVSDNTVCSKAAAAYANNVPGNTSRLSGQVYVVKAGTGTYVVVDPTYYYSASAPDRQLAMVLDSRYKSLRNF